MPIYSELMEIFNFKSRNAVFKLIKKLVSEEYLRKNEKGKITPGRLFNSVKILGLVEAGFPSAAEEELIDTITLDEFLIKNKEATYMLKVKGDSMIDAGIMPGDLLLVERRSEAKDGEIVITEIDNKWTVKYLRKNSKTIYLEPANKRYKPIYPKEELKIAAVVIAVIRKY